MSARRRVEEILQESEQRLALYRKRIRETEDKITYLNRDLKRLRELEMAELDFQAKCKRLLKELG